jgi:hypothetical protein
MHRLFAGFMIVFVLSLATGVATNAQYLPAGSYPSSCRNITMAGNQLSASCTDPQGRWVFSSVNAAACRNGSIANRNGYLHCNRNVGGGSSTMMPQGSYQQSCVNATMRAATLSASCTAPAGNRIYSSVDVTQCGGGNVRNQNGYLACGAYSGPPNNTGYGYLPPGSYQQSCANAYMDGGVLTATCPSPNGTRYTTQIVARSCRGGDIANRNGRLACNNQ